MFKIISKQEQINRAVSKLNKLSRNQKNTDLVNAVTFVTLCENGSIDEVTAVEHTDLFSPWGTNITYKVGDLRSYSKELYRCIQAHTSQADWTPDVSTSLWVKAGNPLEKYPQWSQPIGAQDAYALGDTVTHNDKRWRSIVDSNVWEPGVYGWEEIEE